MKPSLQQPMRFKISGFILSLMVAFFLLFPMVSCKKKETGPPSPAIALIGEEPITLSELNEVLAEFGKEVPLPKKKEELENLKKDLLEQLIQTRIFLQAAKKENVTVSGDELNEIIKKSKNDYSDAEFNDMLKVKGLTYDNWVRRLKELSTIQKLEEKATAGIAEPSPDEIKTYYQSHLEDYKLKAGVKIRQILLATEKEASEAHEALLKGADFAKLAAEKSISPDKALGGDLGVLTPDQMPEGFEVTLTLPVGAISKVIKTSYGYHIFKVEEKQEKKTIPLGEEGPKIKNLLLQEKRDKEFAKWALDLRNNTPIKIFLNLLNSPAV
jgi:peptidyl-prolyl cis-trans isomerase C